MIKSSDPLSWYQSFQVDTFDLEKEEMDTESIQTNVAAKLPVLKQNEFELWRLRIEQFFQVQDYTLWEIIEDGNSFKPTTTLSKIEGREISFVQTIPTTADERIKKKNDLKDRSMLMMTIQMINL